MIEKVFQENRVPKNEPTKAIENLFEAELIVLPWTNTNCMVILTD